MTANVSQLPKWILTLQKILEDVKTEREGKTQEAVLSSKGD